MIGRGEEVKFELCELRKQSRVASELVPIRHSSARRDESGGFYKTIFTVYLDKFAYIALYVCTQVRQSICILWSVLILLGF